MKIKTKPLRTLQTPSFSRSQLLLFALAFAIVGGLIIYRSFAATVYYIAPNGSDSNPCTQSAPCASFNKAYQIASPGSTVEVAGGNYNAQVIAYRASMQNLSPACDPTGEWGAVSTTNCVRFRAQGGQAVIRGFLENHGSSIWLDGAATGSITSPNARTYTFRVIGNVTNEADSATEAVDHVTMTGIKMNGGAMADTRFAKLSDADLGDRIMGSNCVARDSEGNTFAQQEFRISNRRGTTPQNIVIERVYFHDVNRDAGGAAADCHDGAVQLWAANGIIFRQSVWSQNWVYDIDIDQYADNVTLENNWFGCGVEPISGPYGANAPNTCNGQHALQFNDGSNDNWLIRFNSFGTPAAACYRAPNCSYSNIRFVGNNGYPPACVFSAYVQNAWKNNTCGASDVLWNGSYVSTAVGAEDFHLSSGTSNANNLVNSTTGDYSLSLDIDGQGRSAPRDAGADEYAGGTPPPPAPTVSLSANPASITSGASSTLTWNSTNSTACTATGAWSGTKATSGTLSVNPTSTSVYNISCTGAGGSANASATVTVNTPTKRSDLNNDGTVNITDLSMLLSNYGTANTTADINRDGIVNILDLSILLSDYGT